MNLRKTTLIFIVFIIIIIQMLLCWGIDMAVSAMITTEKRTLTNGFGTFNPLIIYHIALYGLIISFAVLMFLWIIVIIRNKTITTEENT